MENKILIFIHQIFLQQIKQFMKIKKREKKDL